MDLTDVPWDPGKSEDVTPPPSPPRVGSALCPGSSLVDVEMDFPSVGPSRETRDPIPPSPMLPSDSEEGRPAPVQSEGPSPIARPSLIGQGQPDVIQSECSEPQSPANECDPEPVPPIGEMPAHPSPGDRAAGRSLSIGQGSPGPSPSDQTGWTEHPVDPERTHSPCDRDLPVEPARSVAPEVDDSSTEVDEGSEERAHPAGRGCPGYSTPETPHAIGQELTETSLDADPSERAPPIGQEPAESAAEVLPDARGADRTPGGQRGGRSHPAGGDLAQPRSGEQPDETIGLEFSQRSSAEQESERAHPPGQKPAESLSDDQRVGGAPAAGEEAIGQEPAAGEDTERSHPSGGGSDGTASAEDGGERGLAEPAPVGRHTERRRPIGEELAGLSLADRHVERTHSIGQEAPEPLLGDHGAGGDLVGFPPDDQHIGRNNSIGQELTESSLDGKATGESGSAPLASGDRRDETAGSIGQEATLRPERSHPIGEELSHHPAERGPPIGQDLADSALDGHHVEGARSIGQQLSEPSPDDEDIESCRATGGELAGLPLDGGNFGGTPPIGQDLADSTLDGHHVEGAHSIGQQVYEPSPDDEDIESCRATGGELAGSPLDGGNFGGTPPIGQDLADLTLDGHHVEGARSIGQELTEPSWDQEDTERTRVIGEELHESSPAGDHVEMDYYICQELTASTPGGQCTEQTCPIGEEIAGLPPLGGHHTPRTLSIGQEHTESVLDDLHSERTHPIGQQLIELPMEDHHSERAHPIGQQLIELPLEDHQSERAHSIGQQQIELQMEDHHSERTLPIGQQLIELQMEDHQSERAHPIGQQLIELPLEDHQSERACPIGQNLTEAPLDEGTRAEGEGRHESGSGLIPLAPGDRHKETVQCIGQELSAPAPGHVERAPPVGREDVGDHLADDGGLVVYPPGDVQAERRDGVSGGPRGPYEGGGEEVVDGPRGKVQVYFLVGCPEEAEEEGFRKRASTLPTGEAGSQRRGRATLRRQEALAAQGEAEGHPPLAKCSSCPTPEDRTGGETEPAEKRPDGRSGSRDWHRRGIRRPSMATIVTQGGEEESAEERAEGSVRTETRDAGGSRPGEVNLRRRESRILHICQPLYQEYIHQALDREIRRQRPSDACPSPEGLRGRRGPSLLQRASLGIPTGLWRDLPEVRNSIDFENVGPEESKLQEVKFELISSEASYLRSLDIAVNHFQGSETLNALLVPQERQWLFSKLPAVRTVSQRFLAELEENFEENVLSFDVCGTLLSHLPEFRVVYIPYLTNQSYQEKTFKNLIKKNPQFLRVVESLEAHPICQRLTLKSFLILPFQRIARLRLLVQNILQRSVRGSEDEEKALRAAEGLGELMRVSNENVCRLRHTEELIALSRVLDFESKIFPLVSQSRRLVKHGSLTEIEQTHTALTWRKGTTRPIYLHLFNDCILLSRQRENGRFTVFDHSTTQNLVVQSLRVKPSGEARFLFQLSLRENHRGRYQEFLLRASSQSQKLRWISALRPMKQDIDLTKHYKSKQVQCLKPYKPREFDEMPLQKADIIIVTQESSDGWEEGYRLSDGDRGWFPSSHVEVITSYRSRVRNIEERLHLSHKSSRSSGLP